MIRFMIIIACCACTALVMAEGAALGIMWQQGLLTAHNLKEVRLVFTQGSSGKSVENEAIPVAPPTPPSLSEVATARAVKTLDIDRRDSELKMMSASLTRRATEIALQQQALQKQREEFQKELADVRAAIVEAGTEQARGVLTRMKEDDAANVLISLPLADNVRLMKGMSEQKIAKILKAFASADNLGAERKKRGEEIFAALSAGEPESAVVNSAGRQSAAQPEAPAAGP